MAIFERPEASGGASFRLFKEEIGDEVCPEGQHVAKCINIKEEYDVEVQKFQSDETEKQNRIAFLFEVTTEDGKSLIDSRPMKISGHEKSALFAFLKAWLGKAPAYGMDTDKLKGHPALVTVVHKTSQTGRTYPVLDTIVPLPKAMAAMMKAAPAEGTKTKAKAKPVETDEIPF